MVDYLVAVTSDDDGVITVEAFKKKNGACSFRHFGCGPYFFRSHSSASKEAYKLSKEHDASIVDLT